MGAAYVCEVCGRVFTGYAPYPQQRYPKVLNKEIRVAIAVTVDGNHEICPECSGEVETI